MLRDGCGTAIGARLTGQRRYLRRLSSNVCLKLDLDALLSSACRGMPCQSPGAGKLASVGLWRCPATALQRGAAPQRAIRIDDMAQITQTEALCRPTILILAGPQKIGL